MPKRATKANDYYRPNCTINMYFNPGHQDPDPKKVVPHSFLYNCTSSSRGWTVQPDGSIHPPSKSRIVEIRLNYYLEELIRPARFAGFYLGVMGTSQGTDTHWTPKGKLAKLGIKILTPGYPKEKSLTWKTFEPLAFDMTDAKERFVYSLAVSIGDDKPVWDDPKIYDDGSQ